MNIDLIDQTIDENHRIAYRIIQFFFSIIDFFLIFLFLCITKCYLNTILKLFTIMVLDVLVRVMELSNYFFINSFLKELLLSLFSSIQFFLIISYINNSFMNSTFSINQNGISTGEYVLFTFAFGLIVFPFETFMFNGSSLFFIFKSFLIFTSIYLFYTYFMNKYKDYLESLSEKAQQNVIMFSILKNMLSLSLYSFSSICFVKLLKLALNDKLYVSYLEMGLISLKEAGKYAVFILLGTMSFIIESETDFNRSDSKYSVTVNQNME